MSSPSAKKELYKICFLIGFDRSGSSMISRMLAQHPEINLLFHPFNSTEVTQTQWEYWNPGEKHEATFSFLKKMIEGVIDKQYIKSDWFYNYSKSTEVKVSGLNIVKDTKIHFKIDWLKKNFPEIDVFGIRRDPRAILYSLMRNDFHLTWYGHLTTQVLNEVCSSMQLLAKYREFIFPAMGLYEVMAVGIAMRTEMLQQHLSEEKWLVYEDILTQPDVHLNAFTAKFGLKPFSFSTVINKDYNVVGKKFEIGKDWKSFFDTSQLKKLNSIFQYLK